MSLLNELPQWSGQKRPTDVALNGVLLLDFSPEKRPQKSWSRTPRVTEGWPPQWAGVESLGHAFPCGFPIVKSQRPKVEPISNPTLFQIEKLEKAARLTGDLI